MRPRLPTSRHNDTLLRSIVSFKQSITLADTICKLPEYGVF